MAWFKSLDEVSLTGYGVIILEFDKYKIVFGEKQHTYFWYHIFLLCTGIYSSAF
jgi:hypothetical protein